MDAYPGQILTGKVLNTIDVSGHGPTGCQWLASFGTGIGRFA